MKDDTKATPAEDFPLGRLPEGTYVAVTQAAVEPQRQDGGDLETHLFYISPEMANYLYRKLHRALSHLSATRRRDTESPSN